MKSAKKLAEEVKSLINNTKKKWPVAVYFDITMDHRKALRMANYIIKKCK